jgi:hypothetical protein
MHGVWRPDKVLEGIQLGIDIFDSSYPFLFNMRHVQPETLPKNSNFSSCLFRLEFRFRSHDFSFNLFPVWQPYC